MSSHWNLPPGVSPLDYQVGGARSEWEADETCPHCGWEGPMVHEEHPQIGVWAWCANPELVEVYRNADGSFRTGPCRLAKEGFEIEPQEPDWEPEPNYGDWRGPDV
jgi:hypothetical protein